MRISLIVAVSSLLVACISVPSDPLSVWQEGEAKQRLNAFIANITDAGADTFVAPEARIAVFDNDGTLWAEEPWPVSFEFIFWRIRQLAPANPDWMQQPSYRAVIERDTEWLRSHSRRAARELSADAQAGISVEEYEALVVEFLASARHPESGLKYTDMAYEPMLQLIKLLQNNDFAVFVVSGGDADFIRAYAEQIYGVPKAHVIGSQVAYKVTDSSDGLALIRQAEIQAINIGGYKAVNIHGHIGRRPVFAAGNSDGDLRMLQFIDGDVPVSLGLLLKHDDSEREYEVVAGTARTAAAAADNDWLVVSMRNDFKRIYRGNGNQP